MTVEKKCKILIVEDELIVRKALRYIIEQEAEIYEIIGEVTNGEEALEFLQRNLPHIMICDIMMPRMDGIELLRAANLKYPEVSSIVLSGYHDFEYVKNAFKYGVIDYILKPELESEHLLKILHTISKKLGLMSSLQEKEGGQEVKEAYPFHWLIAVWPGNVLWEEIKKQELIISCMEEMIKDVFGRCYLGSVLLKKQQVYVFAAGSFYVQMFDERLQVMLEKAKTYLRNLELLIMGPVNAEESFKAEAEKLAQLFPYRFFDKERDYIYMKTGSVDISLPPFAQKDFFELICQQKIQQAGRLLVSYLRTLKNGKPVSQLSLKKLMESTLYNTIFELGEAACCPKRLEASKMTFLTDIGQADSLEQLIDRIENIYGEIDQMVREDSCSDDLYRKMIQYIQQHYHEPITVKTLAEDFNMNYSYLSAYFSSHMGQGINEFLNSIRVEQARILLTSSDLPLSVIAQQIGYTDQSYFGKVFKKQTGFSPYAYRSRNQLTEECR